MSYSVPGQEKSQGSLVVIAIVEAIAVDGGLLYFKVCSGLS
jgi:hypothetical protein